MMAGYHQVPQMGYSFFALLLDELDRAAKKQAKK